MTTVPAILPMLYAALPPEINTGRLMAGGLFSCINLPFYKEAWRWRKIQEQSSNIRDFHPLSARLHLHLLY